MDTKRMDKMIEKVASECVAVRLRMLNRVITNIYDDALRPLDLKVSQMNILVAAAKMGTARPTDVCKHLHLDVSPLSRNVEPTAPLTHGECRERDEEPESPRGDRPVRRRDGSRFFGRPSERQPQHGAHHHG
jgi:hypothetical protein